MSDDSPIQIDFVMFPKSVSGTSLNILKNKAQHMLAEFIIVAAQSCQNGQCPTTKDSSVVATTVTVINGPPAWLAYYDTKWTYGWIAPRPSYSSAFHQMLRGNLNDINPIG